MTRTITLELDGVSCQAVVHDDATTMSDMLWAALPIAGHIRHVRWSGEAGYVLDDRLRTPLPPERRASFYGRAQIMLRPDHGELAIGYGQGQARDPEARGSEACHIASIVTNVDEFLERVKVTRLEVTAPIMITRGGDSR